MLSGASHDVNPNGEQTLQRHIDQLNRESAGLLLVLEAAPNPLLMADHEGRIVLVNAQTEKLFGYHRDELLGQPVEVLLPERFRDQHPMMRNGFFTRPEARPMGVRRDLFGLRKDGGEFPVEVGLNPIRTGKGVMALIAFVDISQRKLREEEGRRLTKDLTKDLTEQRLAAFNLAEDAAEGRQRAEQAEQEIRKLNLELEQRVRNRTAELEAVNKELEAFCYSVSHDLRSPLRAIDGFSRILLEDYAALLPEDGRRYLRLARENTQRMGRLIDDLLTFSRLGRHPLQTTSVAPTAVVRTVLAELHEETAGRQVEIVVGELPTCHADPALLKQVFANLLTNAFKYTRAQPAARIEIGCRTESSAKREQGEGAGKHTYFVKDNGAGFDMLYAHKLFGVFQRLHRAEDYEGTGVGLAIVQRIIHRHGGRVWAEAAINEGATFYFTLV